MMAATIAHSNTAPAIVGRVDVINTGMKLSFTTCKFGSKTRPAAAVTSNKIQTNMLAAPAIINEFFATISFFADRILT